MFRVKNKFTIFVSIASLGFIAFVSGAATSGFLHADQSTVGTNVPMTFPAFQFQRDLKLGSNSEDVRQLQILLNNDPQTAISSAGIGSKGEEGTYFGSLTLNAVKRFQEKYRSEILTPSNIVTATGYVGGATRKKLNSLINSSQTVSANQTATSSTALPLTPEKLPKLFVTRPSQVSKGSVINLVGKGFDVLNTIHVGSLTFSNISPLDGSNIKINLPATSTIPNGTYSVWVENSKGKSSDNGPEIDLTITDNPVNPPIISSISSSSVSVSDVVTVIGNGFASTGNKIISIFGTIDNLTSDGAKITFPAAALFSQNSRSKLNVSAIVPVDFYIINSNGSSNSFGHVEVKL